MKLYVTGVLDDGSAYRPGVPRNPRKTLQVVRGSKVEVEVEVVNPAGASVDLSSADVSVVFTVKTKPLLDYAVVEKVATKLDGGTRGRALVTISPTDWTDEVQPGRYLWDLWIVTTSAGVRVDAQPVIPTSPFVVEMTQMPPP